MIVFLWLYLIAAFGGGLSGICVAGGRNCRIDKGRYYFNAVTHGVLLVHLLLIAVSVLYGFILISGQGDGLYPDLEAAGEAALRFYGVYAVIVIATFACFGLPNLELRTLTTVVLFGPLTLVRPVVILAGFAAALVQSPRWQVALLFGVASAGVIAVNRFLCLWLKKGRRAFLSHKSRMTG